MHSMGVGFVINGVVMETTGSQRQSTNAMSSPSVTGATIAVHTPQINGLTRIGTQNARSEQGSLSTKQCIGHAACFARNSQKFRQSSHQDPTVGSSVLVARLLRFTVQRYCRAREGPLGRSSNQ